MCMYALKTYTSRLRSLVLYSSYVHIITVERTYVLLSFMSVRAFMLRVTVRTTLRMSVRLPESSRQYGTYVLTIFSEAVALVTVELPYLGCTSVPRRLPQDSDTAGSILLSQPVGLGSGPG